MKECFCTEEKGEFEYKKIYILVYFYEIITPKTFMCVQCINFVYELVIKITTGSHLVPKFLEMHQI